MVMCMIFTTISILVNTYGNYVSDYTQVITQVMVKQKCHPMVHVYVENTKNHVCCEIFFYPRDVCLLHLSKTIICNCFGVKLSQKSSSGIMLVHRCYAQCKGPRNVTGLDCNSFSIFVWFLTLPLLSKHLS